MEFLRGRLEDCSIRTETLRGRLKDCSKSKGSGLESWFNRPVWTKTEALRASEANISVIAVGIGYTINYHELLNIAAGDWDKVINSPDFDYLEKIIASIGQKICDVVAPDAQPTPTPVGNVTKAPPETGVQELSECGHVNIELGLVLDTTGSIQATVFEKAKEFLQELVQEFRISPNETRVAFLPYGPGVYREEAFNLTTHKTKAEVVAAIANVTHKMEERTDTAEAMIYMRKYQLAKTLSRSDTKRVALVITDGKSQEYGETITASTLARADGIHVIAVGVGADVNDVELHTIAGNQSNSSFHVDNFPMLVTLMKPLMKQICNGTLKYLSYF
ncbi:collagen alpha-1(XII) chain [Elysia marginata]|uniref:Collagen alpha-1(XII) chain n=1 Tax=Elysia marginata TaxID=1093978 RepID=A0AAV4HA71_9GAST|nr:collagen alpha-1(XII) chain [Elysia marginata]